MMEQYQAFFVTYGKTIKSKDKHLIRQHDHQCKKGGINTELSTQPSASTLVKSRGAMSLKLNGASVTIIMKMGCWRFLTFLQYIHNQIAHLSKDISKKMNKNLPFQKLQQLKSNFKKTQQSFTHLFLGITLSCYL